MIAGEVTADREAVVPLTLVGAAGLEVEVEAALDTGFTGFLVVPPALVPKLQLAFRESSEFSMADGSVAALDAYDAVVIWDAQERTVLAVSAQGGPLIGMSMLYGHRATLDVVDGGSVTIESL